jgi:WD40 repeat protein
VAEQAVKTGATLWRLEQHSFDDPERECALTPVLTLGAHDGAGVRQVLWNASGDVDRAVSVDGGSIRLWALNKLSAATQAEAVAVPPAERQGPVRLVAAAWNPHSAQQISTINDCALRGWDLRTFKYVLCVCEREKER